VGKRGALAFLEQELGMNSPEVQQARAALRDERRFSRFIDDLASRLIELYTGPSSEEEKLLMREEIFGEAVESFQADLQGEMETDRFASFGLHGMNNAHLVSIGLYHRHFNLFESVVVKQAGSIPSALEVFREVSRQDGDLVERTREWLS